MFSELKMDHKELVKIIPFLHKTQVIDVSINQYCESVRIQLEKCIDFETKRQFMLDYIEKIVYLNDTVEIHGSVPVKLKAYEDQDQSAETAKIEFCINS